MGKVIDMFLLKKLQVRLNALYDYLDKICKEPVHRIDVRYMSQEDILEFINDILGLKKYMDDTIAKKEKMKKFTVVK